MKKELENKIFEEFPKLYRQKDLDMTQTCMFWGLDVGDGWYDIIYDLSKKITFLAEKFNATIEAHQVKEKYGTLSFYYCCSDTELDDIIQDLVNAAENKTAHTCEVCGNYGKLRGNSWVYTSCDEHSKEDE